MILFIPKKILPSLIPEYQLNISNKNYNILSEIIISVETKLAAAVQLPASGTTYFQEEIIKLQEYWRFKFPYWNYTT
jgi:hypothetical protein